MFGLMMLAAIATDLPTAVLVDRVEAAASRDPCVRPLRKWRRQYQFAIRFTYQGISVRHDLITVSMIEAGHDGLPAGRFITAPLPPPGIDDSQFKIASGQYDLRRGRFLYWICGLNLPQEAAAPTKSDHR